MPMLPSKRLASLGGYAFDEVDKRVAALREKGVVVIDFGVGDPQYPTPELIRSAAKAGVDKHATSGYPSYIGSQELRQAACDWMGRRFGVSLNPATEMAITIGSKEAIFNFPEAILNPGDLVLAPAPGYPPYRTGTLFAEGSFYPYPLSEKNGFLPDFEAIPTEIWRKARILWLCYPNSPTGVAGNRETFVKAVELARQYDLVLASDEAYSELYFGSSPHSALEFGRENIVVFQSLSKRSAMTGYRVGFMCGDANIVSQFKKLKTNIDSGVPGFVQEAAIAAFSDEEHVREAREDYRKKRDVLVQALQDAGIPVLAPEATIYVWLKVPGGRSDVDFAMRLLEEDLAMAVVPGSSLSVTLPDGTNPGAGFVRFALCPSMAEVQEAATRLKSCRSLL